MYNTDFAVTIKKDAKPGTYPVSFFCDGAPVKGTITKAQPKPQVETKPQGAPQTGGGAESESSPVAAIALGGAGVAAAGGLGFFALRRRKNNA
ncbi:hypothetical protein [Amycolatopsis xylanica]|uniref:hypothetical protein n=1 Tax=Amycolatopsis xylanica TaxID=589385 RepID=UPI00115FE544|nr:hypothetical protein [Amycolatopsis xylanica]